MTMIGDFRELLQSVSVGQGEFSDCGTAKRFKMRATS